MKGADFLQSATRPSPRLRSQNLLQTSVRVRQLTPEELRARGITIDARNYDVYEYTFPSSSTARSWRSRSVVIDRARTRPAVAGGRAVPSAAGQPGPSPSLGAARDHHLRVGGAPDTPTEQSPAPALVAVGGGRRFRRRWSFRTAWPCCTSSSP